MLVDDLFDSGLNPVDLCLLNLKGLVNVASFINGFNPVPLIYRPMKTYKQ